MVTEPLGSTEYGWVLFTPRSNQAMVEPGTLAQEQTVYQSHGLLLGSVAAAICLDCRAPWVRQRGLTGAL